MPSFVLAGSVSFPWWFIVLYFGAALFLFVGFLLLVFESIASIKTPTTKYGRNRRQTVCIIWSVLAILLIVRLTTNAIERRRSTAFRSNLAVAYAKSYQYPVILPKDGPYKIYFEGKWGQIELLLSSGSEPKNTDVTITQVPVTPLGKRYFDPAAGYCDFQSMRENFDVLERSNETCKTLTTVGNFTLYESTHNSHYATYGTIALQISEYASPLSNDMAVNVVKNLKITNNTELASVIASDHFTGDYAEVLDRWHKEGKF